MVLPVLVTDDGCHRWSHVNMVSRGSMLFYGRVVISYYDITTPWGSFDTRGGQLFHMFHYSKVGISYDIITEG